ncbi:MAG: Ig-like domain-containing protein [Polyangiales bacterium]
MTRRGVLTLGSSASAQCGNGVIDTGMGETCDDGGMAPGDGCSAACTVETGWGCVPSLFATGVNDAGAALPMGDVDPHWTWSQTDDPLTGVPAIATRNVAWPIHAPGQWVAPSVNFGNELTTGINTFWFQEVNIPAAFAGALTFPIVVSCDNICEVFVNGTSFGGHNSFLSTNSINIPASAFVAGANLVTVRLEEGMPGTPRGILIYPGGGGILSQCTEQCMMDSECDDGNDCTVDTCLLNACTNSPEPLGTACGSGGACNGSLITPACETCVDSSAMGIDGGCNMATPHCRTTGNGAPACEACLDTDMGSGTDLGCLAASPYCLAGPGGNLCAVCIGDADCDDGNPCTTDSCSGNNCQNTTVAEGATGDCTGGDVCSGAPSNVCVACTDNSAMGTDAGCTGAAPHCRETGLGSPTCEVCLDTSLGTDLGCSSGAPFCVAGLGGNMCVGCLSAADCSDGNDCTADVCAAGICLNPAIGPGATCTAGVCDGAGVCEGCLDNGGGTDTGCTAASPNCIGASGSRQCVECVNAGDCDDSVACTTDACVTNNCVNTSVAVGNVGACTGGDVCSGPSSDMCVACADTDTGNTGTDAGCMAAAPFCDSVGGVSCEVCVDAGAGTDPGCDVATPNCVVGMGGANECVSCTLNTDCDDGNECTDDVCGAGMCTNPAVTEFTTCSTGVCTAASMCAAVQVTITSPVDQSVSNDNMPTLTGTGTPGATIELSLNAGGPLTTTVDASGNWSLTLSSPLDDGGYGLLAIINVALLSDTDMVNFAIDTVTEVAIVSPADGTTSLDSTPLIQGTGEPGATIVVSVDGTALSPVTVNGSGMWMVNVPSALSNDIHTIEADATDLVGNTASTSSTFTVAADTFISISEPDDGIVTRDNTPTIGGNAQPGASVVVTTLVAGTPTTIGSAITDGAGFWSFDVLTPLPDAMYIITATATDLLNAMASDSSTFTVDTVTAVTIVSVDPLTGVIGGTGEPGATVVVSVDGTQVGTTLVAVDGSWQVDADSLSVGQHTITADATDVPGNTASDSTTLTVTPNDGGTPDMGMSPDGGGVVTTTGGVSGGALCATQAPSGASWPGIGGLLLVGLALVTRRRKR